MKNELFSLPKNIKQYDFWTCQKVTDALIYLLDNIYIRFGSKLYRQNVGIPMGTNCVPLLAHLSRRLTGQLIGYPWSGIRPFTFSKIFSKTTWPIKAKFYVEPPWVGGTKVRSRHLGHMANMADTPIYGKNPSKIFSRTGRPIFTKLGM